MTKFYVKPSPVGVNPPRDEDRKPIHVVTGGDSLIIESVITLVDKVTPIDPDNSTVRFALSDQKFSKDSIWEGTWFDGVQPGATPGRVLITVPDDILARLRRGSFLYSLLVSDKLGNGRYTALAGSILVEYAPTSPTHNIPYKS